MVGCDTPRVSVDYSANTSNRRDHFVLRVWNDEEVLLSRQLIVIHIGPIKHHKLIVGGNDNVLGNRFKS